MPYKRLKIKAATIKTRYFTLRPLRQSDAQSIAKHINDKTIFRNTLAIPYPYTLRDALDWLKRVKNHSRRKNPTWISFGIEIDGEVCGDISLMKIHGHKAEIGYWLGREHWGKGIMTKAVIEITRYGFDRLGFRRIYANIFPHNKASMRVVEKAGYKFEGIQKKAVKKGDRLIDEYLFASTR